MQEYMNLFIDKEYPTFLDKYFSTKTLKRLKYVTQFCGADYTKLYSPTCLYTRYDHSIVVAHMTWHFNHDKVATIVALLHDVKKQLWLYYMILELLVLLIPLTMYLEII